MAEIDCASLPRHLAIIMDGNGRWAEERMLQRIVGHQKGVETVRTVVEECSRLGIGFLTLYAFSAENWLRPRSEVTALMTLLKKYIAHELPRMMDRNVRFNVIGTWSDLPTDVQRQVTEAMTKTAANTGLVLTLALSYGGRQEIAAALSNLVKKVLDGALSADAIDEATVSGALGSAGLPDPDLLIRTGGEMRVSNFLLWQLAYSELYFTPVRWPDFTVEELRKALDDYRSRERRFGKTSAQLR